LFPSGFQSAKVIYSAGYAPVPADLQIACAMMVQRLYLRATSATDPNMKSERIGDYSYVRADAVKAESATASDVESILSGYKRLYC